MNKIFRFISMLLLTGCFFEVTAQEAAFPADGVYYVVRHAEKDTGRNPQLTADGRTRAGDLYRRLEKSGISRIYTTNYLRTKMTGDSLRVYQNIDTVYYAADTTGAGLAQQITKRNGGRTNVLIIGHSNTVPAILRKLGVKDLDGYEIPETQFNNLFIVEIKKGKVVNFRHEQYGEWSP